MKSKISTFIAAAGIVLLVINGCATQGSVQKQISDLQDQVAENRAEITMLKSSDAEQNMKLSELSGTIQDAVVRVQQLRDMAEGRFLYETTISDDGVLFAFDRSQLSEKAKDS